MSDPNILVSNGTCYTASGSKLDDSFIPCGNDAFGHQTCCGKGDNCLADNACFGVHGTGYGADLTYWAGCTDSSYKDASCPKKQVDQPWVALTRCDDHDDEWAICSQSGDPTTLQNGAFCSCTVASSATIAFTDASVLSSLASLPQSTGASIQFFAGHQPTTPASGTAAATQSGGSAGATQTGGSGATTKATGRNSGTVATLATTFVSSGQTITSTIVSTSDPSSTGAGSDSSGGSSTSSLPTGAKIGIGVGAAIAGLLALALLTLLLLRHRKRRQRLQSQPEVEGAAAGSVDGEKAAKKPKPSLDKPAEQHVDTTPTAPVASSTAPPPNAHETDGQPVSEAGLQPAQPWSMRSELEGSRVPPHLQAGQPGTAVGGEPGGLGTVAELPGSENFAGEQGAGNTLALEARRQLGSTWRDSLDGR